MFQVLLVNMQKATESGRRWKIIIYREEMRQCQQTLVSFRRVGNLTNINHVNCASIKNATPPAYKQIWIGFVCGCWLFFTLSVLLERINKKTRHFILILFFFACISLLAVYLTELFWKLSQKQITHPIKLFICCL